LRYAEGLPERPAGSAGVALADRVSPSTVEPAALRDLEQRLAKLEAGTGDDAPERVVTMSSRSVLQSIGILLAVVVAAGFVYLAWGAISLMLIALLAALGLNPAVEFFVGRGLRRGLATGLVFLLAIAAVALLGLLLIPPLVTQVTHAIDALPGTLADLSKGRGPFGFLERKFHIVEEANKLVSSKSAGGSAAKVAGSGVSIALGVAGTLVGLVVIGFLTFFMLLEGPDWVDRIMSVIPEGGRPRCRRIGAGISRTVGGFVTGNLVASVLGGTITALVLWAAGLPYPVPLGVLVGVLDLLPIFGALIALLIVAAVSFFHGVGTGLVVTGVVFLYHQFEVYYLRPVIYGRMIELSPLAVLVAAVIGTELAGPLGAIAAIPAAGAVQLILVEILDARAEARAARRRRTIVEPRTS
jgi:predicted PurR-regulated permease PerM